MIRFALVVLTLLCHAVPSAAQTTWYVNGDNCPGPGDGSFGNPFCSIQLAIDMSANGDTVIVAPGTYTEAINFIGREISVQSSNPMDPSIIAGTVIDGTGNFHTVMANSGETAATELRGFVITGGNASQPADVDSRGGGLYTDAPITVSNCTFAHNTAFGFGGGAWSTGGATFTTCYFVYNTAAGAAAAGGGGLSGGGTLYGCGFEHNEAEFGGGVYVMSPIYNDDSIFQECAAGLSGGAMYFSPQALGESLIAASTFRFSVAVVGGGAIAHEGVGGTAITSCVFSTCQSPTGGACEILDGTVTITGTTFCEHVPGDVAGGWVDGGDNAFFDYCPPEIPLPDPCPGDVNGDGVVDILDLLLVLGSWGLCP